MGIGDIVEGLSDYCLQRGFNSVLTCIWICCLCINQHRVQESREKGEVVSFDDFAKEFGSRVKGIRRVLALVMPWDKPLYITRVWCIYELHVALQLEGEVELDLHMPPREKESYAAALEGYDVQKLWSVLGNIRVEKAEASVPADKESILRLVHESKGFAWIDFAVSQKLKEWCANVASERADMQLEMGHMKSHALLKGAACRAANAAWMFDKLGKHDGALKLAEQTRKCLNHLEDFSNSKCTWKEELNRTLANVAGPNQKAS